MVESAESTSGAVSFFQAELARLGPHQPPSAWSMEDAERYCRQFAHRSYENFTVVSWFLPNRFRQDFYNVYAYCRWSDDLADEVSDPDLSLSLLEWWQQQLSLCFSGRPSHPVMVALQRTVHQRRLDETPFFQLLSAFRQDQTVVRYADDAQLTDYCTRSANPVGRILLRMAEADDEENCRRSDAICTGLQLANFCQDMHRDAQAGRIYAPQCRWAEHGVTEAQLLAGRPTPELRGLLKAWVQDTREYFERGASLVERIPNWLALDIDLFVRGGRAVLDAIERQEYDVWSRRPVVNKWSKVKLLAQALCRRRSPRGGLVSHADARGET